MKNFFLYCIAFLLISVKNFSQFPNNANNTELTADEIKSHINYLASDELKGRFTGTNEELTAAKYIESEFKKYGLTPFFNNEFLQTYSFTSNVELRKKNNLSFVINNKLNKLSIKEDFITASFSRKSFVNNAKIVFAGYGISAPKLKYDDYENIDVKNKIVIVLRYHPEYDNPHSEFDKYSSFRQKAQVAKEKGAAGIILVNGVFPKDDEDKLMNFIYDRAAGINDFSSVHIKRKILENLFNAEGKNLSSIQKTISETKKPFPFEIKNSTVSIETDVQEIKSSGHNVAGFFKSSNTKHNEDYIIIGAHFDHLGFGFTGSLYRGKESLIHNGADDNASGTTGVLELAEKFSSLKNKLNRNIVFAAFSGEELGLLGSNFFVNNLQIQSEKIISMINMDMIGRLDSLNNLIIYGTGTSAKWKDILNNKNYSNFKLTFNDEGYGPSDHSSFYSKQIPVLFFFTGTHSDYHRPSDDADKINHLGEEKILKYIFEIINTIDTNEEKPNYLNVPRKESEVKGGWKVYVGTIPDYSYQGEGFKLTGVSEGSPAFKSGIKAGDILLKFGNKKINNIYDYVYALQEYVPGDIVEVIVKRNNNELILKIELGAK